MQPTNCCSADADENARMESPPAGGLQRERRSEQGFHALLDAQPDRPDAFSGRNTDQGNAADAATHCSRYMEVSEDGIYYTGWRLPTEAEIKIITEYQYGNISNVNVPSQYRVLTPVLTGYYYWDLAGGAQRAWQSTPEEPNYDASQDKAYLRCVRDLSADEVDRLNGFDKIQEKYR